MEALFFYPLSFSIRISQLLYAARHAQRTSPNLDLGHLHVALGQILDIRGLILVDMVGFYTACIFSLAVLFTLQKYVYPHLMYPLIFNTTTWFSYLYVDQVGQGGHHWPSLSSVVTRLATPISGLGYRSAVCGSLQREYTYSALAIQPNWLCMERWLPCPC